MLQAQVLIVSNTGMLGITNMATLQRLVAIQFPAAADRSGFAALHKFAADEAKQLLPYLLELADKSDVWPELEKHDKELSTLISINRYGLACLSTA